MKKQIIRTALLTCGIFVFTYQICAQSKAKDIFISASLTSNEFSRSKKPEVKITISNKSGKEIKLSDFHAFQLILEKSDKPYSFCRYAECFNAILPLSDKKLQNESEINFVTKLAVFYWHNSISSFIDPGYPRNLFSEVPSGQYNFFVSLSIQADNWKKDEPRYVQIKSNETAVNIKSAVK